MIFDLSSVAASFIDFISLQQRLWLPARPQRPDSRSELARDYLPCSRAKLWWKGEGNTTLGAKATGK